jgi:hypothetical protein
MFMKLRRLVGAQGVAPTKLFGAFGAVVDAMGRMVLTMRGDRELAVLDLAWGGGVHGALVLRGGSDGHRAALSWPAGKKISCSA